VHVVGAMLAERRRASVAPERGPPSDRLVQWRHEQPPARVAAGPTKGESMGELRFDGRVAIVTGAGGRPSLGRAYAHLLAARGAKVVVNDLGVGPDGRGIERAHADVVAQEIVDAGGEAIADVHSVADRDGAQAIVQAALDAWGRVDVLVNNAGVCPLALFEEISDADIQAIVDVHLMGQIWMSRAVWPHMLERGYGRIVNITSGALLGLRKVPIYGAAKAGAFGLMRALAVEGAGQGIAVNAVSPAAGTVAITHMNVESEFRDAMMANAPEQVAPVVAYLAHETCELTGRGFDVGGGHVDEYYVATTSGYTDAELTVEGVRDHLDAILDRTDATPMADAREVPDIIANKPYVPA
jgi:NAD(P)-dependent dehydrogenase (short-subunit alcohol dehydrogenase family)